MAEHIGRIQLLGIERIERGDAVGLFVEFQRAPDIEFVVAEMEGCHVPTQKALELAPLAEHQPAHSRMHPIGTEYEREVCLGAVDEGGAHRIAGLPQRRHHRTEANVHA